MLTDRYWQMGKISGTSNVYKNMASANEIALVSRLSENKSIYECLQFC